MLEAFEVSFNKAVRGLFEAVGPRHGSLMALINLETIFRSKATAKVYLQLLSGSHLTVRFLKILTGVSEASIHRALRTLSKMGLVEAVGTFPSGRRGGPPPRLWRAKI